MTMPNFLIIGAPRSGTTSLHRYIQEHPQIFMSEVKELRFFALEGKQLNFCGPCDRTVNRQSITNLENYQEQFKGVTNEKAIGESSPIYLWWEGVPERIKSYLPNAKLISIFRNPIERAYSDFLNMRQLGWEPLKDFAEALKEEENRIKAGWGPFYYYQRKGFYYSNLERFYHVFPKEQIRLYLYEDLFSNLPNLLQDIFRFLEVDDGFLPDIKQVYNASNRIPKTFLGKAANKLTKYSFTKPLYPVLEWVKKQQSTSPPLPLDIKKKLVETYRGDILKLQENIGRDLSGWLKV
ncbi:MAG: sulfotransferase [Okeania sp. SIO3I5]|uniref:sulfotransferase family protein n=1 Tax=Okeania sp. SIO3I5 TaxID=2607805 RepID=UPI0013BDCA76|nr:sulfotransferase [Okeania sp. SIO3I5]NEQ39107.1 sulfotransferase [Okeania sp. SIO3I5]